MAVKKSLGLTLSQIVMTAGVNEMVASDTTFAKLVMQSLKRHNACDWGDVSKSDAKENNRALRVGGRLMSVYGRELGQQSIWIITEADRSVTTVLFPSEY